MLNTYPYFLAKFAASSDCTLCASERVADKLDNELEYRVHNFIHKALTGDKLSRSKYRMMKQGEDEIPTAAGMQEAANAAEEGAHAVRKNSYNPFSWSGMKNLTKGTVGGVYRYVAKPVVGGMYNTVGRTLQGLGYKIADNPSRFLTTGFNLYGMYSSGADVFKRNSQLLSSIPYRYF